MILNKIKIIVKKGVMSTGKLSSRTKKMMQYSNTVKVD